MASTTSGQTASWREVQEVITACGDAYQNETRRLHEREADAARVLELIGNLMNDQERALNQDRIPATLQRTGNSVTLSIGSKESISGGIGVEQCAGGKLKVARWRCRAGEPPDEHSETRSPDDFGTPHLYGEFVAAYKWIFHLG